MERLEQMLQATLLPLYNPFVVSLSNHSIGELVSPESPQETFGDWRATFSPPSLEGGILPWKEREGDVFHPLPSTWLRTGPYPPLTRGESSIFEGLGRLA